jgi:hypothetical protein
MGLLSFLLKKKENSAKDEIIKNIDIMAAINAHLKWKSRLDQYVSGTSTEQLNPQVICLDDQCVLGKWIHGPAREFFREDEKFIELREDHVRFHLIAAQVVKLVQGNDIAGAEELLRGSYMKASRKVVKDLSEMGMQFHDAKMKLVTG